MSKPDSTGAKSLEEILSSIRKSLAEEATDRPPEPRLAPAKAVQPEPKPASSGNAAANGAGLSSKLAGALNGAASAPAHDDDLSELLATEPKKPVPSAPASAAKPPEADGGDPKDPLWFLSRLSAAAAGKSAPTTGPAARARDAAKAPVAPPAEEVRLSRPEVLRASLPPLFGGGEAARAPKAPADAPPMQAKAADSVNPMARTEPRGLPWPAADGKAEPAQDKDKAGLAVSTAAPAAPLQAFSLFEQSPAKADPRESLTLASLPLGPAPSFGPELPAPVVEAEPAFTPPADPEPQSAAAEEEAAPGLSLAPAAALPTRALEQVVAELLEPVIQQWLQGNLPRLIEKVVREEAARAVAAERDAAKV